MPVYEITSNEEFAKVLTLNKAIVDFYAPWCGPCMNFANSYVELSNNATFKNVKFFKLNVDDVQDVAQKLKVQSLPTFMVFSNGKIVAKTTGANKEKVIELLNTC